MKGPLKAKKRGGASPPGLIIIVDRTMDPHLVVYHDPKSLLAEQYRSFRTNLMALNRAGSPRSILFTSTVKGEGKSVTAANIGICVAELPSAKAVIIDADFRAPVQDQLFGLEKGPGLADLILDGLPLDRILLPTKVRNLYVIRSGRQPRNPSELLGSERMLSVIHALKAEFNFVLFDSPPVNPFTDAATLAALTDGVVFVVRMERTHRTDIERAIGSISDAGGRVIGTFLTALEPREREYYEYAGYE
ncbi:MAG: CpsD/CapB family tyrosine-protein kinase [Planctomycetota bacterium]